MAEKKTTKTTTGTRTKPKQTTKGKSTTNKSKTATKANKSVKDITDQGVYTGMTDYAKGKGLKAQPDTMTFDIEEQPPKLPKRHTGSKALTNPIDATPTELSTKMAKLKVIYDWDKINLDSDDEVEERISDYFNYCIAETLRPTIEGLAMALGIDRRTLWTWETGSYRAKLGNARLDIVKKAKDYIAFLMSDMVMDGKINPITWIFYAKNYFGMKDTQDLQITASNALQPTMSMEEIAEKVNSDVVIDVDYE